MKDFGKIGDLFLIVSGLLIAFGLFEAIVGWCQILGFTPSLHLLYPATGTFYNPGPYGCFLALVTPLALYNTILCKKSFFHWEGIIYLIVALSVMPVLMSRTGWIAAAVGMLVTAIGTGHIKKPNIKILLLTSVTIVVVAVLMYRLKPASALGRLFLWKTGVSALGIEPLKGVGWAYVPGALGLSQESYFSANPDSVFIAVAGSPEYAFNEIFQIGIAFGIPVLIFFIALLIITTVGAWKGRQYGITGSIVALIIVCLASYPFQFTEFLIFSGLLLLTGICSIPNNIVHSCYKLILVITISVLTIAAITLTEKRESFNREWSANKYAYQYGLTENNIQSLDSLVKTNSNSSKMLFDYGKALRESGHYEKSTEVLQKGLSVSSDPMFLNLIGRNYQDIGQKDMAEKYYHRSISRLPERMYPYYLLGKLYADSIHGDSLKFIQIYEKVMTMDPKVMSPAIEEMRKELQDIYNSQKSRRYD